MSREIGTLALKNVKYSEKGIIFPAVALNTQFTIQLLFNDTARLKGEI